MSACPELRIASPKLLDKRCINPYFDALHIDSLRLIPAAHLGKHQPQRGLAASSGRSAETRAGGLGNLRNSTSSPRLPRSTKICVEADSEGEYEDKRGDCCLSMKSGDERNKLGRKRCSDDGEHQRSKQDAKRILAEQ